MRYEIERVSKSTVEKIHVKFKNWGWADYLLEDHGPERGQLVINSDWGCWSYFWGAMGERHTLATFLLQADNSYIIGKLMQSQKMHEFDAEETLKAWKKKILEERRRMELTAEEARHLWGEIDDYNDYYMPSDETLFIERLPAVIDEWLGHEPWEHTVHKLNSTYQNLDEVILPAMRQVLREQQEKPCQAVT
jgi:hypothetical protein